MLLPPDPNNYPTTIQGDLQYQVDLRNFELKCKNAINEINFNQMRNEVIALRGVLERAQIGLKWYQYAHPEDASNVDDELHEEIDALLFNK